MWVKSACELRPSDCKVLAFLPMPSETILLSKSANCWQRVRWAAQVTLRRGMPEKKFRIGVSNYRNSFRFVVSESHLSGLLGLGMRVHRTILYCVTREGRQGSAGGGWSRL